MGVNNIPTAVDGAVIPSSDHNAIKEALAADHVPRNTDGIPTSEAGSLGRPDLTWLNLFFGLATNQLSLTSDGTTIIFKSENIEVLRMNKDLFSFLNNGSQVASIGPTGIQAGSFPTTGVLPAFKIASFTSTGTFVPPADVIGQNVVIRLTGGGGGGGSGQFGGGQPAGGGGGGGTETLEISLPCVGNIACFVGGGGAGGFNGADNAGIGGTTTVVMPDGRNLVALGGFPGGVGVFQVGGGTNDAGADGRSGAGAFPGGAGGGGSVGGTPNFTPGEAGQGVNINNLAGGAGGAVGSGDGGPGGGGGASLGSGGAGGIGGFAGSVSIGQATGVAGSFGGGGGGGGGRDGGTPGSGGAGGAGLVQIFYVSHL